MPNNPTRVRADGARSILVERRFDHAPARVLAAHIDPALMRVWNSTDRHPMTQIAMDGRPGGAFSYTWGGASGGGASGVITVTGRFEEITARRILHTEVFEPDWTGGETRVITDFRDDPGSAGKACLLEMQILYASAAPRDAVLAQGGLLDGLTNGYAALDHLL